MAKDDASNDVTAFELKEAISIDEDQVLECIEEALNSLGRGIAYTVYLNWSAIDREKNLGIFEDPQSFCDSLYSLFGESNAKKIELLLARRLSSTFPGVLDSKLEDSSSDFVSCMVLLKHHVSSVSEIDC